MGATSANSRVSSDWLPWVVAATTAVLATSIYITYYHNRQPPRRKIKSVRSKPRHLDIDIDLSNDSIIVGLTPSESIEDSERTLSGNNNGSSESSRSESVKGGSSIIGSDVGNTIQMEMLDSSSNSMSRIRNNSFAGHANTDSTNGLDPAIVRSILEHLLDITPADPPVNAFVQAIAGTSGRPAQGQRHGTMYSGIAVRESTDLPPFHAQIKHIMKSVRSAKQRGKPLLIEGPPGLGKGTALQQLVSDDGKTRPAIYLQLSVVMRKRHGASSMDDEEEEEEYNNTETETECEGSEERVSLSVKRDAWKKAVERALGVSENMESPVTESSDSESNEYDYDHFGNPQVSMTMLNHIAQALRLIASKSRAGPTLLVIDDIQLLFRDRKPLSQLYDGIPEVFAWLLRCESEGILDVILSSSEKSAIGALKRLRGYDWGLTLHAIESVPDEIVIKYLLEKVNPCIADPSRRFTENTAALFVATFDGSLLELDNYYRDVTNVHTFIAKRERSLLRRLHRHLPSRVKRNKYSLSTPTLSSRKSMMMTASGHYRPPTMSSEEELRELFLDIIMRGGVLPVAKLDVEKMELVEALVERNILRWRDQRIRKREQRANMRAGWKEPSVGGMSGVGGDGMGEDGGEVREHGDDMHPGDMGSDVSGDRSPTSPIIRKVAEVSSAVNTMSRVFGLGRSRERESSQTDQKSRGWFGIGGGKDSSSTRDDSKSSSGTQPPLPSSDLPSSQKVIFETDTLLADGWVGPVIEDGWAGVQSNSGELDHQTMADLDAAEQLALLAREGAELVWSNNLVRTVCEGFVGSTQLQW